jgi:hypothetical protein
MLRSDSKVDITATLAEVNNDFIYYLSTQTDWIGYGNIPLASIASAIRFIASASWEAFPITI